MSKRGQLVLRALGILLVSAILILMYPYIGEQLGKREFYKKVIAVREVALILDTIYAYSYDTTLYYEKDLSGLIIEASDKKIMVYNSKMGKKDPTLSEYHLFPTGNNILEFKIESPKRIRIDKTGNIVTARKDETNKK